MTTDYFLYHGDARKFLTYLPANSQDALVTDPPYGLTSDKRLRQTVAAWATGAPTPVGGPGGFQSRDWDKVPPSPEVWGECLRVLKPGAHGFVFAGQRTQDVIGLSLRLAGFEIRGSVAWLYGSGAAHGPAGDRGTGWTGTCLKTAHEPILLVRKPLEGSLAANAAKWRVGGLNIDAARIACSAEDFAQWEKSVEAVRSRGGVRGNSWSNDSDLAGANPANPLGRWPVNAVIDENVATDLDATSANKLGVSRYFYCAKAAKTEYDAGLEAFPLLSTLKLVGRDAESPGAQDKRAGAGRRGNRRNPHPTIKPLALVQWLVRLVTLPGMAVVDPFMGSGTTGVACAKEGRDFIGCELLNTAEEPFYRVAEARVAHAWRSE